MKIKKKNIKNKIIKKIAEPYNFKFLKQIFNKLIDPNEAIDILSEKVSTLNRQNFTIEKKRNYMKNHLKGKLFSHLGIDVDFEVMIDYFALCLENCLKQCLD